jgi:hypothetical protein
MDRGSRTWTSGARLWSESSSGWRASVVAAAALLSASGCVSRGNTELLEANLRQHQDRIASYERQVSTLRDELASARGETDQLRRELVALGKDGRQEASEPLSKVAGIQFNSMMTGGRDSDGQPGHDVITAVLAPHDGDGDLVKLGGELEVEVLDLTRPADQQRIGNWKYSAEQARELWHSGFLASGFQLDLPVGVVPKTGEVILHGRLKTTDGRQFDTTCPVTLASAESVSVPRAMPMPRQSRPVSNAKPKGNPAVGKSDVMMASAELRDEKPKRRVEQAGIASLDEAPAPMIPKRPVPRPIDLPRSEELPVVRPGNSPRPFPGASTSQAKSSPRPFPNDLKTAGSIQTSDSWTPDTIPTLR